MKRAWAIAGGVVLAAAMAHGQNGATHQGPSA
jgi:hypothetical protein